MPSRPARMTRRDCLRRLSAGAGCLAALGGLGGCGGQGVWDERPRDGLLPRVFWGDVHTHTNLSDGKCTLDELLTCARDQVKLDFIILTDHDFGHAAPWRMPQADWNLIQDKADQYTVPGRFVVLAGYEWTSQAKYWTDVPADKPSERLFPGRPKNYNHKCVYFPGRVERIFSAKDAAFKTPDSLAEAVAVQGGLIHHAHPTQKPDCVDQWECQRQHDAVMCNTEIFPDGVWYKGKLYDSGCERAVRQFLASGGRCGFVGGSDTHDRKPQARTGLFADELTRQAVFDALRHRRNYSVFGSRVVLDFRIDGQGMGREVKSPGEPALSVSVVGTAPLREVAVIRDGAILASRKTDSRQVRWEFTDRSFRGNSYYYLRVTQADADEHGNPTRAWSSPIWGRAHSNS